MFECGLLRGSYIPPAELKEVRDLTRYRMKTVQARTSEIQRLGKALESTGIKLGSVASGITGVPATAMIEGEAPSGTAQLVAGRPAVASQGTAGVSPMCLARVLRPACRVHTCWAGCLAPFDVRRIGSA